LGDLLFNAGVVNDRDLNDALHDSANIDGEALKELAKIKTLKVLSISPCNSLTNESIGYLSDCPELWGLEVSGKMLNGDLCRFLTKFRKLCFLTLRRITLTTGQARELRKVTNLNRLGLTRSTLTPSLMETLVRLPRLGRLDLKDCTIAPGTLGKLRNSKVAILYVEANVPGTYLPPAEFKGLTQLNFLKLKGFTRNDGDVVRTLLPKCHVSVETKKLKPVSDSKAAFLD
ncbi:MAG: hypothetical protein K2Z81_04750, partial [Cyanobacteria bacterium]|nr:hypothetical protein [Cyanobacteriota bacterium]